MMITLRKQDWWKWGDAAKRKSLTDYPVLMSHLEERWGVSLSEKKGQNSEFKTHERAESPLDLAAIFNGFECSTDPEFRLSKTLGKSYKDILLGIHSTTLAIVDAVLVPKNSDEVQRILEIASRENIVIVPFGGGSNVVSDFELPQKETRPVVVLDLGLLNSAIEIDPSKRLATFQAGIYGPALEKLLNEKGMSLGHFPQSFEYSTLGGWIVTRSAGQESSAYGRIEDQTVSIKVATPKGALSTSTYEGEAAGVNLKPVFFGSEGSLGVVTEATVKIHPLPQEKNWVVGIFPSFNHGLSALRLIVQKGLSPSVVRFSDEHETFFLTLLSSSPDGIFSRIKGILKNTAFKLKKINSPSLMMIRFEGDSEGEDNRADSAKEIFRDHGALLLGSALGKKWEHSRYGLPYLRDDLVERSIVVDTMETVLPWDKIEEFRVALRKVLDQCPSFHSQRGILLTHVSHVYGSCASMYFTVLTPMNRENALGQWKDIKKAVTDAIVLYGGAVSHHHGVGRDHQPWLVQQSDTLTREIIKSIKLTVDPNNILNPGKLFDDTV